MMEAKIVTLCTNYVSCEYVNIFDCHEFCIETSNPELQSNSQASVSYPLLIRS
jgi:hypothetical protein